MIKDHDFIDAYFTNNERTVVESIWWSESEKVYRTHVCKVEDGNPTWEKLLETVSIDDLHERTWQRLNEMREELANSLVEITSDGDDWIQYKEKLGKLSAEAFLDVLFMDQSDNDESNKEKLFVFKLALFDWEKIKNVNDKEFKRKLRKAGSIAETVGIIIDYFSKS